MPNVTFHYYAERIMLIVVMLIVIMLIVVMLAVVMPSVVAPFQALLRFVHSL